MSVDTAEAATRRATRPRRGRPPGRTAAGRAVQRRLYESAIALIAERGYDAATLRDVAARAGVSQALVYRYFPSKRALVLAFHDELLDRIVAAAAPLAPGRWRDRFNDVLELELSVLRPHRTTLRALVPLLASETEEGLLGSRSGTSARIRGLFAQIVAEATDAPAPAFSAALGRILYLAHVGVVLWWLIDRSVGQRATDALVTLLRHMLPSAGLALRLGSVRGYVMAADDILAEAVFDAADVADVPSGPVTAAPRPS
jgi:AcrR family transcriptional regulator